MAVPNVPCIKKLFKLVITLAIIVVIAIVAIVIVGNLKVSTLGLDTLEIAEGVTMADAGLADEKFFVVIKSAWSLCRADEKDYVVNPYDVDDREDVNEIFSLLPQINGVPKYAALLSSPAVLNKGNGYLYRIEEGMLTYVLEQVFASSDTSLNQLSALGLRAKSVVIDKDDMTLKTAFGVDVTAISSTLPDIKVFNWPETAYLNFSAKMSVDNEGRLTLSDRAVDINGLDEASSNAIVTALYKIAHSDVEGDYIATIKDTVGDTVETVIGNIGRIGNASIDGASQMITISESKEYGAKGILDGGFQFLMNE